VTLRYLVDMLLFDLDGTLIEPSIDFARLNGAVLAACEQAGVQIAAWRHLPALEILDRATDDLRGRDAGAAEDLAITADRVIMDIELEAATRTRPYPGVSDMLRELLDAGYKIGVVTRNCRSAVEIVLGRWPLPLQVVLTRDDVARVKPDPGHLIAALESLDAVYGRVLVCGDHPMDVAAGKAIGAVTAAVCSPAIGRERLLEAHPDLILDRITDLARYLDGALVANQPGNGSQDDRRRG